MELKRSRTGIISGLLAAAMLGPVSAVPLAADELWDRVMTCTDPTRIEQADSMVMDSWERSSDGEETSAVNMVFSRDGSTGDFVLQSATEDGRDVTERERRRQERGRSDDQDSRYAHEIFNPEKSGGLELTLRPEVTLLDGRECRIYDFVFRSEWPMGPGKPKPVTEQGVLFVDAASGMPLMMESRLVEGPDLIQSFEYRLTGSAGAGGRWRLNELSMDFIGRMIVTRAGGVRMRFQYSG